jgi:chromosome segregation ATPase
MAHALPPAAPAVRLELRHGSARSVVYDVTGEEFVLGSAVGCDLRLPGSGLPPLLAVLSRQPDSVRVRKLAAAAPLLLNGQPFQTASLHPDDTLTLGPLTLTVHIEELADVDAVGAHPVGFIPIAPPLRAAPARTGPLVLPATDDGRASALDERQRRLDEQAAVLEADRVLWYRRREEVERECRAREQEVDQATAQSHQQRAEVQRQAADLQQRLAEADRTRREHDARTHDLDAQQQELDALRTELTDLRRDLHQRYQERRDRLAGLQQSVETAARKVQDRKRQVDLDEQVTRKRERDVAGRLQELERREQELAAAMLAAEEEQQRCSEKLHDVDERQAKVTRREQQLAELEVRRRDDLVRLEQRAVELEQRENQVQARTVELEGRAEKLRRETATLETRLSAQTAAADERATRLDARAAEQATQAEQLDTKAKQVAELQQKLDADRQQVDQRINDLNAREAELDKVRDELAEMRRDLYQRYQERRDRLAGIQQAVQNAARKVQERKRQVDADTERAVAGMKGFAVRQDELERREQELKNVRQELAALRLAADEEIQRRTIRLKDAETALAQRQADLDKREQQAAEREAHYQDDLARLDRVQGTLEQRERQAETRDAEVNRRYEQLEHDTHELEEQARQLDAAQVRQRDEAERLQQQKIEVEAAAAKAAERSALVEGQQAMLATLRTRLERMRGEVRQESQQLAEQRARHEATERELHAKMRSAEHLLASVDTETQTHALAQKQFEERSAALQEAVVRMRQLQDKLAADELDLKQRSEQLAARDAEHVAQAEQLRLRAGQLLELQQKLDADRQALREREAGLVKAEEARKALQEQLRRRSEDLATRQKQLDEQARQFAEREAQLGQQDVTAQQSRERAEESLAAVRQELDQKAAELQRSVQQLAQREDALNRQVQHLKESGRTLAADRKSHHEVKTHWEAERAVTAEEAERRRAELDAIRRQTAQETADLQRLLPDLELRGQGVLDRLAQAREQFRGHLSELHNYARQSQEELQVLRAQVQAESEQLRQQELGLQRARSEHRLAVTAFRQQLIEWQGRVTEMRQVLAQDGTRLERKQAEVAATSQQLARQAAELHVQERQVVERRGEVERHLNDMREWYRRKLRELAESRGGEMVTSWGGENREGAIVPLPTTPDGADSGAAASARDGATPAEPTVLSLADELDPGDRQLGDLLHSLDLVDADTLTALLHEARRQRRSLRQVLLSARGGGGAPILTLYQLALIEAGNLDGLVLGRLRVIDRLPATPRETVYRVFDPQRAGDGGGTVLLRHLAEAEMQNAVHPDEFRQRFAALAAVRHPHILATLEVLEINGRPAALQEWLNGLPSSEWPPLAAVPGVWYRLVYQAALGLHTAHEAGLLHGRLSARSIALTSEGVVKLTGCGEPTWLTGGPVEPTSEADMAALGELAAGWAAATPRRKGTKAAKPLPESLQQVVQRLRPDAVDRYPTAAALLEDLEAVGADLPDGAEAWAKLLQHAVENATEGVAWRKSA